MANASDNHSSWREKYTQTQQQLETFKKDIGFIIAELRRDMSRVSIAANGIDPMLDAELRLLRQKITNAVDHQDLHQQVERIADTLRRLEEHKTEHADQLIEHIVAVLDPLKNVELLRKQKKLQQFFKRIQLKQHQQNTPIELLQEIYNLITQCISEIQQALESKPNEKKWWHNLFSVKNKLNETLEIPDRITAMLNKILSTLDVPEQYQFREEFIRNKLEAKISIDELSSILDGLASLIGLVFLSEKNKFEEFITNVNKRLDDVQQFLGRAKKEESDRQADTLALDSALRSEVGGIRSSIQSANALNELQKSVQTRLDNIMGRIDTYKEQSQQRMHVALETIVQMNVRLLETEEAAKQLQDALVKQRDIAEHDPLTRLYNRNAYDNRINELFNRWKDYQEKTFLILGDLDHFKNVNDDFGHAAGDQVLKIIGRIFLMHCHEQHFIARFGGEEFVILISDLNDVELVLAQAEQLRKTIAEWQFTHSAKPVQISMSFGVAQFNTDDTVETLFNRADKALYLAKEKGRNRVEYLEM